MKQVNFKSVFSALGLFCVAFSCILLFYGNAKAYCSVTVSCPNGGTVSCSGDVCNGYSNYVSCRDNGGKGRSFFCR